MIVHRFVTTVFGVALTGFLAQSVRAETLSAVHSMLTRDGRRMVSRMGANDGFELVATNALPKGLPSVRPWRIYVVKATHTDIWLHNSQYIQRHGMVKRIEDAMRLVDADRRDDDDPAAYRYVMGPCGVCPRRDSCGLKKHPQYIVCGVKN